MAVRRNFFRDRDALTTVEFVIIFPFFMILVLYALEVGLALFWWQSVEEAAQLGARLAVTWDPAVQTASCPSGGGGVASGYLPTTNCKISGSTYIYGQKCGTGGTGNCVDYGTPTCDGGASGCNLTAFNLICDRMRYTFGAIPAGCPGVKIAYHYSGLGFAGGPVVPDVTVSVSGVPFNVIDVPILPNIVSTLPTMSASLTGEDLSSSGGS